MPDKSDDVKIGDPMTQEITGEIFGNARYVESIGGTDSTFHLQGPETILFGLEDEIAAAKELGTNIPFTADDVDGDYVDSSEELGGAVFLADPDAPLPLLLSFEAGDETYEFQFSDWDAAGVPEDIDPEQIASDADLNEAAQP